MNGISISPTTHQSSHPNNPDLKPTLSAATTNLVNHLSNQLHKPKTMSLTLRVLPYLTESHK